MSHAGKNKRNIKHAQQKKILDAHGTHTGLAAVSETIEWNN